MGPPSQAVAATGVTIFVILGVVAVLTAYFLATPKQMDLIQKVEYSSPVGWVAIVACFFTYGSYGVFIKSPSVVQLDVYPAAFQIFMSLSTVGTLACVGIYNQEFHFKTATVLWGILGAGLWVFAQLFSFIAINAIGYAVGPAIWAGITVVVSYIWGVALIGDIPKSTPLSVVAIILLLGGIALAASCGTNVIERTCNKCLKENSNASNNIQQTEDSQKMSYWFYGTTISPEEESLILGKEGEQTFLDAISRKSQYIGVMAAVVSGILNGSLQVPLHYYSTSVGNVTVEDKIGYLANFSVGVCATTPVICTVWWLIRGQLIPLNSIKKLILPGLATGFYWACGYFEATYATIYLGNTVGYPLTQTCIWMSAFWGVVYYKEIQGKRKILSLMLAAIVVLGGSSLLAVFG